MLDEGGIDALRAMPARGRPARLDGQQLQALGRALLDKPTAHGFGTELWTLKRVGVLIERMYGVKSARRRSGASWAAWAFSMQTPERRAIERDEEAVQTWKRTPWLNTRVQSQSAQPSQVGHLSVGTNNPVTSIESAITLMENPVPSPLMNLDEVTFDDIEENGFYTSSRGQISDRIGAEKLGYNLTVLPPGKAQCPFHNHHGEEEMFFILEGSGELRFGEGRHPIRQHDVIACPTGGAEVAHQIVNTGSTTMRYLAISTVVDVEVCEYPDSRKILVASGKRGQRGLRKLFLSENTANYYDRENTDDRENTGERL